jgi:hypothetical protein
MLMPGGKLKNLKGEKSIIGKTDKKEKNPGAAPGFFFW